MPENLDLAELKRLDDERRRTNDSDSPDAGEADYQYELYLRQHTADILAMGAECERLHAAAMGCPHSLGEGAKPVHELTNYLTTHLPAILAMGAECERLRGERGALAARQARIQAIAEEPDTLLVNPAAEYVWLHDDSQSRKRMTKIRTLLCDLDFAAILTAHDALVEFRALEAVQAEVTELKAANVTLEARIAELEEELAAWEDWTD
jgi:hypothetical protein